MLGKIKKYGFGVSEKPQNEFNKYEIIDEENKPKRIVKKIGKRVFIAMLVAKMLFSPMAYGKEISSGTTKNPKQTQLTIGLKGKIEKANVEVVAGLGKKLEVERISVVRPLAKYGKVVFIGRAMRDLRLGTEYCGLGIAKFSPVKGISVIAGQGIGRSVKGRIYPTSAGVIVKKGNTTASFVVIDPSGLRDGFDVFWRVVKLEQKYKNIRFEIEAGKNPKASFMSVGIGISL